MSSAIHGKSRLKVISVLQARCPACNRGPITRRLIFIRRRCPECGYDFQPEPGFYLGAMMVSFLATAVLTVPPVIILKLMNADTALLVAFPLLEYLFLGTLLLFYSRVLWLHLEYSMTHRLEGESRSELPSDDSAG